MSKVPIVPRKTTKICTIDDLAEIIANVKRLEYKLYISQTKIEQLDTLVKAQTKEIQYLRREVAQINSDSKSYRKTLFHQLFENAIKMSPLKLKEWYTIIRIGELEKSLEHVLECNLFGEIVIALFLKQFELAIPFQDAPLVL